MHLPALALPGAPLLLLDPAAQAVAAQVFGRHGADSGAGALFGSTAIHAAPSKATPVDADEMALADSAAGFSLSKLTWANLKATLKTYFDSLATTLTNKTLTAPVITGNGKIVAVEQYLPGAGGTVNLNTGLTTGFAGILVVATTRLTFTAQSRRVVYAAACWGTTMTTTQLHLQDGSGGGSTFTIALSAAGIITATNTSGQDQQVNMSFYGNLSAG